MRNRTLEDCTRIKTNVFKFSGRVHRFRKCTNNKTTEIDSKWLLFYLYDYVINQIKN